MNENNNNEHFKVLSNELTDIEKILIKTNGYKEIDNNNTNTLETLNYLDECHISIFDNNKLKSDETLQFLSLCNISISEFKKSKNNKIKIVNKKYKLFQYGLSVEHSFIFIEKFATLSDISTYLANKGININLKSLIKNKLFKVEIS